MNSQSLKEVLSEQFGSDEAFGLYFITDDGEELSLAQFEALHEELGDDMPGAQSYLADGGSGVCCTDYASFIFKALPGRVQLFGFANEENPTCVIARDEFHPGGHDFAVVDGRYLVDPWCLLVAGVQWPVVYDFRRPTDLALAALRYGPQSCWTHMTAAEAHARAAVATQALRAA